MSAPAIDRRQAALLRALAPLAGPFTLLAVRSIPWSSATFDGARHRMALRLEGADGAVRAARLCATLGERDLAMRGGFVADLVATARVEDGAPVLGLEALTIDDA